VLSPLGQGHVATQTRLAAAEDGVAAVAEPANPIPAGTAVTLNDILADMWAARNTP
jgi:hypothetical protein